MLSTTKVLNYIKSELGFPWQFIELTDDEIISHLTSYTLQTFAHYFPDENIIGLNLQTESNRVPSKANEYYITDPEGREILGVSHLYFSEGNLYMFGHPPLGAMSFGELGQWALSVELAGWVKSFSSFNYTYVFKHPNIISIRPTPNSEQWVAVEYERSHAEDFSTIPNDLQMYFLELCLCDIGISIGRIRKKYSGGGQGIPTPFGNIPLSDDIFEEFKEKRAEVLEKLTTGALTNVTISFG